MSPILPKKAPCPGRLGGIEIQNGVLIGHKERERYPDHARLEALWSSERRVAEHLNRYAAVGDGSESEKGVSL